MLPGSRLHVFRGHSSDSFSPCFAMICRVAVAALDLAENRHTWGSSHRVNPWAPLNPKQSHMEYRLIGRKRSEIYRATPNSGGHSPSNKSGCHFSHTNLATREIPSSKPTNVSWSGGHHCQAGTLLEAACHQTDTLIAACLPFRPSRTSRSLNMPPTINRCRPFDSLHGLHRSPL